MPRFIVNAKQASLGLHCNSDVINSDPSQPSEIVDFIKQGQFIKQLSVDPAQGRSFGLAVNVNQSTSFLATVDDNTERGKRKQHSCCVVLLTG